MSFLARIRKRPRPSSTSDELCTSWYSTDPKDLPAGFTVGSMSVPYPPPYYKQQSTGKRKKKREKKPKSRKHPVVQSTEQKTIHDLTRLQKSRSIHDLDGGIKDKLDGAACSPPLTDGVDANIPAGATTTDVLEGIEDPPQCDVLAVAKVQVQDSQPEGVNHEAEQPSVLLERVNDSPKEKRLSNRATLQRSCSVDAIAVLYGGQDNSPPETQPQKSSKVVEDLRKPRGISVDEDQKIQQSDCKRPFLTHQPRSYQVCRHKRTVSEDRNLQLAALGYSPDPLKKQPTFGSISKKTLYKPKNVEVLIETIRTGVDVNTLDEVTGNAPIHAIVSGRKRRDKTELLLALLVYSKVDVNLPNRKKMTALHLAIEEGDEMCIRALLSFGANVNAEGRNHFTPLDLAMDKNTIPEIERTLVRMGAETSSHLMKESNPHHGAVPRLYSFAENMKPPPINEQSSRLMRDVHSELANQQAVMEMYRDLEVKINQKLSLSASHSEADESPEEAYALLNQQRELNRFNKTLQKSGIGVFSGVEGGSRILFLDGGGIKGLVQLEVLMQLEAATGRKVTDLFDWIVGTSTGGVIALTLVYGKKSLREIFQLYFMMKDRIFSKSRIGFGFNTEVLEEILQEYLDPDVKMTDVTHPKVLISAVNKATTNLELHFFNNCFGDEYMDYPVWKVARYTSATPMFFSECDNYIDGGVICNNPTEYGLTAIQNFFRQQGKKLPIALVVSIGTGVYPAEDLGSIDLFLGIGTLTRIKRRTQNLISLLGNALVESEMVATNSQSRCREQGIPFYRFSPKLRDVIAGSETDNEKLFNMVIQTRIDTREQGMEDVVRLFHTIAGASHHLAPHVEEVHAVEQENQNTHNHHQEEVPKEKPEMNANLNHQSSLLAAPPSSQAMLSDIEESVEVSTKKSYKLRSPSVHATFVVGGEAKDAGTVSTRTISRSNETDSPGKQEIRWSESTTVLVGEKSDFGTFSDQSLAERKSISTRTASRSNETASGSSETDGPDKQDTRLSESATDTSVLVGEKSDFDTFSDQSLAERKSHTRDKSPHNETDVTRSQNSSVFSAELVSSNELETPSPRENDDDDDDRLYIKSQVSSDLKHTNALEDVIVKEATTSSLEPKESPEGQIPSSVKLEERVEPIESLKDPTTQPVESKESVDDQTTPPVASQESVEGHRTPPPAVEPEESVGDQSSIGQSQHEFSSEETLKDASSTATAHEQERSLTSHGLVVSSEKLAEEEKEGGEEVCSHQMKQKVQDKAKEETPDSAINGGNVVGVIIPKGSSHSSSVSLERSMMNGPPKKKIPRTADDERGVPNGVVHFTTPITSTPTTAEQHPIETHGLANGSKSHTQISKLDKQEEVPNHYKLNVQLTPVEMQQEAQGKFPYRFETEI